MRPELNIIQEWIAHDSRVLDLGCGDGNLLHFLKNHKNVSEIGLEIDAAYIQQCIDSGINVIEQDLNLGLSNFESDSFDTVLLTHTLQAVKNPDLLVDEILRIGKKGIITFPNFGNWRSRYHLLSKGRMPVSEFMPYEWYDTPNIHFCTVKDFDALCHEKNIRILQRTVVDHAHQHNWYMKALPNLLGEVAIYHISKSRS